MKRIFKLVAMGITVAMFLIPVSCQSGTTASPTPSPTPSASPTNTTSGQAVTINLTAQNVAFDKQNISVPPGASVTIHFENKDDGMPHNFAVYETQAANKEIFKGETITGPASIDYKFTAPTQTGDYFFRCDIHPTQMTGTFTVK